MKKQIPNLITFSRIFASIFLFFITIDSIWFYLMYIYCGLSDVLDGFLARKLRCQSSFGSKLDTISDIVFYAVVLILLFKIIGINKILLLGIAIILFIKIINIIIGLIKDKSFPAIHSILNKIVGVTIYLSIFIVNLVEIKYVLLFVQILALISAIDEFVKIIKGTIMKEMKDKLHTGELYLPLDESILKEQMVYQDLLCKYNRTKPTEQKKRTKLLKKMLGSCGEGVYIEAPFYANFGGHNCYFGNNVYANYHLTLVDDTFIHVGDYTMFGPNVTIATAGHPILPSLREKGYQYNKSVNIGKNVWVGAGAIIMPGVTIGDNSVIGAGSIVTKDIPSNVVAVGNPCKVLREIGEKDREFYFKDNKIPNELIIE